MSSDPNQDFPDSDEKQYCWNCEATNESTVSRCVNCGAPLGSFVSDRACFLASALAATVALCLEGIKLMLVFHGMRLRAQSVSAANPQQMVMDLQGGLQIAGGMIIGHFALAIAVCSVIYLAVSFWRQEKARRLIPITLLLVYLLIFFLSYGAA